MKYTKHIILLALTFTLASCYHAQITTDKSPSDTVIDIPWAHGFVLGLVPPATVETASECPNGLAKVETKQSFLNGLVSGLTFSLYTPMHITVTCAEGPGMSSVNNQDGEEVDIAADSDEEEKARAFEEASKKSYNSGKVVYVNFK